MAAAEANAQADSEQGNLNDPGGDSGERAAGR
jgi:hypothetical protein